MQRYTVYFYLKTTLHVLGGTITHHQERKQLYLRHLVFVTLLLLSAAIVEELELVWVCCGWHMPPTAHSNQLAITVWQIPDAVDRVVCAPDDRWWYHPKHVEQFPDKNKLCNVASCCIYIKILLWCTDPWTLNSACKTYPDFAYFVRHNLTALNIIILNFK